MYVGHDRYAECLAHLRKYAQRLEVADSGERVDTRAVGLAVRTLEDIRYRQGLSGLEARLGYLHGHLLTLYDTGTGQKEELRT